MRGAIIINFANGEVSGKVNSKVERLKREFALLGVALDVYPNDGLVSHIENGKTLLSIPRPDFVVYLDKDRYLARLLEHMGIRVFDSPDFIEMCDDKMLTHIALSDLGIPMPKTFAGPLVYSNGDITFEEKDFLDRMGETLGYPFIIKGVYGSLGLNMVLVNSEADLVSCYLKMKGQGLIFQEYIQSSYGRSVRVLVVDNKVLGAFERYNSTDYRSNYHVGASSKSIEVNDSILAPIMTLLKHFDIEYAGVDLLYGPEGMMLCEINSNAFFQEFEKVTGLNAAKAFAEMVINRLP